MFGCFIDRSYMSITSGSGRLTVTWTDILVQISVYSSLTLIAPKFVLHSQLLHQLCQPLQHTLVLSSDQ